MAASIRVLLADDHPPLRAGIRQRLEQEPDLQVVGEAGSGTDALRLAENLNPDVLVLDMQMPGLSGIEVARRLKAQGATVRVLALSAHTDEYYIMALLDSGAAGYLTKQESLETITAAVRGVARGEEGWLSRDIAAALMKQRRARLNLSDDPIHLLSEREREVLILIGKGIANQQIADTLFIAESTVKKHVNNIYSKLEVSTRAEAAAWAWRHGLVREERD